MINKKLVFIGDIHGRSVWKNILSAESNADIFVFLGDYFDSKESIKGSQQLTNFLEIIALKNELEAAGKAQVILLFGNHDYHYMPWHTREPYSGYQKSMAPKIRKALVGNLHHLQMAFAMDQILVSHAGISSIWLSRNVGMEGDASGWHKEDPQQIAAVVNDLFASNPKKFDMQGFESSGDEPQQTPIWIRPKSLVESNKNVLEPYMVQVFGHTRIQNLASTVNRISQEWNFRYFPVDGLHLGVYWVYENGSFELKQL